MSNMPERTVLYGPEEVDRALAKAASDVLRRRDSLPALVGIRRGGVKVMDRLSEIFSTTLGRTLNSGVVDINLYRDDWTTARAFPKVGPTEIGFSLEGRRVLLVDDVLFTGRTVRAALDALSEFGRPACIELLALVDRGHREMPIQADYAPFVIRTDAGEIVEVSFDGGAPGIEVVLTKPGRRL
ncbi:MAG: bifunctional pyr operon transcriptional regulator/uracil phosphoribosyltransferase PyrR [Deltaproteobacteria bacterium]|jgi:pyrimidine operon attenuation protein/uracil phosphoribosyltransferase|nr:bifunctional pyr operon transcriptional regulator/uracil phosphoribosyltransferase PyrR [Deltaproteobacteria bacterium]